jgi:hypothetical protein
MAVAQSTPNTATPEKAGQSQAATQAASQSRP